MVFIIRLLWHFQVKRSVAPFKSKSWQCHVLALTFVTPTTCLALVEAAAARFLPHNKT